MEKVIPSSLSIPHFREYGRIWDDSEQKWKIAYHRAFRRQETVTFIDDVVFNTSGETSTSDPFQCAPYAEFLLLVELDVTGSPTDIYIDVQFSDDKANWYKYMRGPFGDLRWEDSAGDKLECLDGPVLAPWMRLYVVSSGCTSSAYFTMRAKAIFNG